MRGAAYWAVFFGLAKTPLVRRGRDNVVNEMLEDMGMLDTTGTPRKGDSNPDNAWRLRHYFRCYTIEAVEKLAVLMRGGDPKVALAAAQMILDRGWGKAIQQVEVGHPGDFTDLSDEQLEQYIREASAKIDENERVAVAH